MEREETEIDIVEIIKVLDGTVDDLREFVSNKDLSEETLSEMLEAEKSRKNRKTAKELLKNRLGQEKIEEKVKEAQEDLDDIRKKIYEIDDIKGLENSINQEEVEKEEILRAVGGSVSDLKSFVNSKKLNKEQLENLLETEKALKNRKTAVRFLNSKIPEKKLAEDLKEAEEDIENLRKDMKDLEEDASSQDVKENLSESRSKEIQRLADNLSGSDNLSKAIEEVNETYNNETEIEEENKEEGDKDDRYQEEGGKEDKNQEKEENGSKANTEEETEEESKKPESEKVGSKNEEKNDREKKKSLIKDLDVNFSSEEIDQISLDELKKLKREKEKREKLINDLKGDFDEDVLKQASTSDLERLKEDLENSSEEEKEKEEIEEEAEEELEMLMGAVGKEKSSQNSGKSLKNKIKDATDFKNTISNILSREEEEKNERGVKKDRVLDLLDKYKELESREAAIKTAHVMKGYLEYIYDIERELTYKELADEIDAEGDENLQQLLDFFRTLHREEYTGNIQGENIDSAINNAEKWVRGN